MEKKFDLLKKERKDLEQRTKEMEKVLEEKTRK